MRLSLSRRRALNASRIGAGIPADPDILSRAASGRANPLRSSQRRFPFHSSSLIPVRVSGSDAPRKRTTLCRKEMLVAIRIALSSYWRKECRNYILQDGLEVGFYIQPGGSI